MNEEQLDTTLRFYMDDDDIEVSPPRDTEVEKS